jgi:aromatic ring hydroxylase
MAGKNEVRVSQGKPHTVYVGASKEILKQTGSVELHGLGEASSNVIRAAEMLCSLGYASLDRFETMTVSEPDRNQVLRTRNKVVIKLSKAAGFDQAYENFKNSKVSKSS